MAEFCCFPEWDVQFAACLSDRREYVAGAVSSFQKPESNRTQRKVIGIGFPGSGASFRHGLGYRVPVAAIVIEYSIPR